MEKTASQAFWDSDQNLDDACQWIEENYGSPYVAFILFAGQNRDDYGSFVAAVNRGHTRATVVWDRLRQAEEAWFNKAKKFVFDSDDTKSIAKLIKFFDQRKRREEKKQKEKERYQRLLEKMERKKQRLHAKGILTTGTTWNDILTGKVKGYND